jgi:CHAD domain-containing protein
MDSPHLNPDAPLWAWAHEAIGQRAKWMLEHIEGVRLGEDIEAVHDMRVGSRRLVAAMRVFGACFPGADYRRLLREARDVTRRLGAVRDLDVLIDHYEKARVSASPEALPGIDYFIAIHERERKRARKPMLEAMREMEEDDLVGRLSRYLQEESEAYSFGLIPGSLLDEVDPRGSFRQAAPVILEDRYRVLYSFEPYVEHPEQAEQLHEMRIAAKWLRYTMELFAPAYRGDLKQQIAAVKKIQELLGDLHDSDVRLWILDEMRSHSLDPRGLEAMRTLRPAPIISALKNLHEMEVGVRQGCYEAFRKEWRKLARRGFPASCLERIREPDAA